MFNKRRGEKQKGLGFRGFTVQPKRADGLQSSAALAHSESNINDKNPALTSVKLQRAFGDCHLQLPIAQPPLPAEPPPADGPLPPPPSDAPSDVSLALESSELYTPEEPLSSDIYIPTDEWESAQSCSSVLRMSATKPTDLEVCTKSESPIFAAQSKTPTEKKRKRKTRWDTPESDAVQQLEVSQKPIQIKHDNPQIEEIITPDDDCPYQRSADSPPLVKKKVDSSDEEDELDKFMAGIEEVIEKQERDKREDCGQRAKRADIEDEDDQETYFNAVKDAPMTAYPDDEEDMEYDSDGNPVPPERPKIIEPLPAVDHSEIFYEDFDSNFYEEHEDISKLTPKEVEELQNTLGIKVLGADPTRPAISFAHFGFDEHLMAAIRKSEYTKPTPIQSQAVPVALSGRDIIGIAKTGSGKTAAFVWPMLIHIMAQRELRDGEGPIGLIVAPTRELCQQIYSEAKRFGKCYNLKAAAVFGGGSKWEQSKSLQKGVEIVVCTPGRLIDHIKAKATNLERVTYLVFDEADRLFDMGFEPQVRSIANHVRPDRQCLLFSATMKKKVERLCRDILTDPIRIVIGEIGEANEDVLQVVEFFSFGEQKWSWLTRHIIEFCSGGSVLLFVTKKTNSEDLAKKMTEHGYQVGLIHGDFDQFERNRVLNGFRRGEFPILIATDVAARGLDIPSIKTVINYDVARDITTHTHRIGRTGRAGERGIAYTLVTPHDVHIAGDLVRNLEGANQSVPGQLLDLALKNPWFRNSRIKRGHKGQAKRQFKPRDRTERPGFGLDIQQVTSANDTTLLDDDEDLGEDSFGTAKKPARSLFTSYAMSSTTNTGRLANLKAAFSTGYNRFTKASSSASSTMDVGSQSHEHTTKPPTMQTSFKSPEPHRAKKKSRFDT